MCKTHQGYFFDSTIYMRAKAQKNKVQIFSKGIKSGGEGVVCVGTRTSFSLAEKRSPNGDGGLHERVRREADDARAARVVVPKHRPHIVQKNLQLDKVLKT